MRLRVGTAGGRPHHALRYQKIDFPVFLTDAGLLYISNQRIGFHFIISWLNPAGRDKNWNGIWNENDRHKVPTKKTPLEKKSTMTARVISVLSVVHQRPSVCQWCTCWLQSRLRTLARSSSTYYCLPDGRRKLEQLHVPFLFSFYDAVNIPSRFFSLWK